MKRKMTWEEIDKDWAGLQKRHRMEIAEHVAQYCIGHKMMEVAERLGYDKKWVCKQLDFAGVGEVTGVTSRLVGKVGEQRSADNAVSKVVSIYAPDVSVKYSGTTKDAIAKVEGNDAEAFQPYLDHYSQLGHEPAAAVRLAKAEWAAEEAVEAGVIKESTNKRNEKVNRILFPEEKQTSEQLQFESHIANVKRAANFLENAKVGFLKKESTRKAVASAHAKWLAQAEHIRDLHQPSIR